MLKIFSFLTGGWIGPALLAAALAGAGVWHFSAVHSARNEGRAEVQSKLDTYIRNAKTVADAERLKVKALEDAHAKDIERERVQRAQDKASAAAAAARLNSQLDGLRGTVQALASLRAAQRQDSSAGPGTDAAPAAEFDVLGECFAETAAMGQQAEDLASRLRGLQAWARSAVRVCGQSGD